MSRERVCPLGHTVDDDMAACLRCGSALDSRGLRHPQPGARRRVWGRVGAVAVLALVAAVSLTVEFRISHERQVAVFKAKRCATAVGDELAAYQASPDLATGTLHAITTLHLHSAEYRIFATHIGDWLTIGSHQGSDRAVSQVLPGVVRDCRRNYGVERSATRPAPAPSVLPMPPAEALQQVPDIPPAWVFPMDPGPMRTPPQKFSADAQTNQATAAALARREGYSNSAPFMSCINELVPDVVAAMTYGNDDRAFVAQAGGRATSEYSAATTLAQEITELYRLPATKVHMQDPNLVRQGMLDVAEISVLGRCPLH